MQKKLHSIIILSLIFTAVPALVYAGGWLSPVKITDNIYSDEVASINYDGTIISFYSDEDGDYDIYFMEFSESIWQSPVKLTNNNTPDTMPEINEDGTKITYIGGTDENRDIYFIEYSGGAWQEPVQLADSTDGEFFPALSNDGEKIAYQVKQVTESSENRYIWFVERKEGIWQDPVELPTATDNNMFPVISGDGTKIVFFGKNNGYRDIYFLEYEGSSWQGPLDLTDDSEHDSQPSINEDGTKIAYYWTGETYVPHVVAGAASDIRLIEYKNGQWHSPVTIADSDYYEFDPTIDSNGNRITYAETVPGKAEHIYVAELSGTSWQFPENLTNGVTSGFRPNISGDGNTIVYYGLGTAEGVMDTDYEIYLLKHAESMGSISGQVTGQTEGVYIRTTPGGFIAATDSEGYYTMNVSPGIYTVTAVKNCYASESVTKVMVSDNTSSVADFKLGHAGNCMPAVPSDPSPEQRSIGRLPDLTIMWQCSDPDTGDSLTYDVYLGVPTLHHIELHVISGNQPEKFLRITGLEPETNYFWKVVARDALGYEAEGPLWSFTTGSLTSFTASAKSRKVVIEWETEGENKNTGFNIYRSESENENYEKINTSIILPESSLTAEAAYKYTDKKDVKNRKTYFYKLEEVSTSTFYGPKKAVPKLLYWIDR